MKRVTVYGVTLSLFIGACAFAGYMNQESKDTGVEAQIEVPHEVVSMVGRRGVAELKANGCMKSVIGRINGQGWSDDWCADRYKHVF
jgi:hypothetical protein